MYSFGMKLCCNLGNKNPENKIVILFFQVKS